MVAEELRLGSVRISVDTLAADAYRDSPTDPSIISSSAR